MKKGTVHMLALRIGAALSLIGIIIASIVPNYGRLAFGMTSASGYLLGYTICALLNGFAYPRIGPVTIVLGLVLLASTLALIQFLIPGRSFGFVEFTHCILGVGIGVGFRLLLQHTPIRP